VPEDNVTDVQSSGLAILAAILTAILMQALIILALTGYVLVQDFIVRRDIGVERMAEFALFASVTSTLLLLAPVVSAYFTSLRLTLVNGAHLEGHGIIYRMHAKEIPEGRASSFAIGRLLHRVAARQATPVQVDQVAVHRSWLGRLFGYGTLVLVSGEAATCIDFVDHIESVAIQLKSDLARAGIS
jgi:hypothetical protein